MIKLTEVEACEIAGLLRASTINVSSGDRYSNFSDDQKRDIVQFKKSLLDKVAKDAN